VYGRTLSQAAVPGKEELAQARRRYRQSLEEEIRLVEDQLLHLQKKVEIGILGSDDREIVRMKRDVEELRRALVVFDAGGMPTPLQVRK